MEKLLVSACLLGENCKYNGGNNYLPAVERLKRCYELIPVCPERDGGLPTPRVPSERMGERVVSKTGTDVTEPFRHGAELAVKTAKEQGIQNALLKERSPSCGRGLIYDGSFTGTLIPGSGVAAEALERAGITVYGESEMEMLFGPPDGYNR